MINHSHNTEDLQNELFKLRKYVLELERERNVLLKLEKEKREIEHSLGERVKELNCLYSLSELIDKHGVNVEKILQGITDILPISWQYPDITCARILFEENEYVSSNFRTSRWKQSSDIYLLGDKVGAIEVCYIKKMPDIYEGPFLKEERLLIDAVAERIGLAAERIRARKQLEVEQESIKSMNITLREVLLKVQDEKREVGEAVQSNVNKIVFPIIYSLERDLPAKYKDYFRLLKSNLEDIIAPFINELSKKFMGLTPIELQICNMIRKGLTSKEIANLRNISPATVSRHREHIRKKLGLISSNVNLTTYLETYM